MVDLKTERVSARPNILRRRVLPAVVLGAMTLPEVWRRPVINAVLLPAHAQTSEPIYDPQFGLTQVRTAVGVPSGSTTPVEIYSRFKLSACDLPPDTDISVDVIALLDPSGEITAVTGASVNTGRGRFDRFVNVDAGTLIVTEAVNSLRFEITVAGKLFTYLATSVDIGSAAAGSAVPVTCSA